MRFDLDNQSHQLLLIAVVVVGLLLTLGWSHGDTQPIRNFSVHQEEWPAECDKTRTWLELAQDEHRRGQTQPTTRRTLLKELDNNPWCVTQAEANGVVHQMHLFWAKAMHMKVQTSPCLMTLEEFQAWRDFSPEVELVGRTHAYRTLSDKELAKFEPGFQYVLNACSEHPSQLLQAMEQAQAAQNVTEQLRIVQRFYRLHYEEVISETDVGAFIDRYPLKDFQKPHDFAEWYMHQGHNSSVPLPKLLADEQDLTPAHLTVLIKKHWERQGEVEAQVAMAEAYIDAGYDEDAIRRSLVYQLTRLGYYKTAYQHALAHSESARLTKHVLKECYKAAEADNDYETVVTQWGTTIHGRVILMDRPHN